VNHAVYSRHHIIFVPRRRMTKAVIDMLIVDNTYVRRYTCSVYVAYTVYNTIQYNIRLL